MFPIGDGVIGNGSDGPSFRDETADQSVVPFLSPFRKRNTDATDSVYVQAKRLNMFGVQMVCTETLYNCIERGLIGVKQKICP